MSLPQRFERRLEGVVGSAFARVFKGQVEPVEIGNALQREAGDKHSVMGHGQVLAPNRYRVSLGPSDYERLAPWEVQLCNSLAELVQEYLDEQGWTTVGDIEVILHQDGSLHTGVFGVASRMEPAAAPRQRPYDSLSLPVVPGLSPGRYERPFGTPAAPNNAYDHHGAPEMPFDYERDAPLSPEPVAAVPQPAEPAADPWSVAPAFPEPEFGRPQGGAYPASPPPAVVPPPPPVFPQPAAPLSYGQDPYAPAPGAHPAPAQPAPAQPTPAQPAYSAPAYAAPVLPPHLAPRSAPATRGILAIDGSPTHIVLRRGSNVVGRGYDADLQILDQGVSRRHVDVQFDGESAVAYDLGSTNGTSVNGHQIGSRQLQHGDVVRVGHTRIVYHQDHG